MWKKYAIVPFVLEKQSKGGGVQWNYKKGSLLSVSMSLVVNDLKAGYVTGRCIWGVKTRVLNVWGSLLQTSSRWVAQVRKWKLCSGVDTGESAAQWKFPAAHPDCDRVLPKPYGWFSIKTLFTKSCRWFNFLSGMDKIFFGVQCFHFSLKTKLVNSSNVE